LALTCFLFWSGKFALPRHPQRPCFVAWVHGDTVMRVSCTRGRAASSASRLLVMVPFLDTVSWAERAGSSSQLDVRATVF
jgi:hypothetical protein